MSLDKLKTTWKLYKQQSDLPPMQIEEILEIIQISTNDPRSSQQLFYFNLAILLLLVFVCQGG